MVRVPSRNALSLVLFGWLFFSCVTLSTWEPSNNLAEDYDVTIYRDTWGVPHIFGPTDSDVAFGLAYAHAEDDLENIEFSLLAAQGIMASYKGIPLGSMGDFGCLSFHETKNIHCGEG